MSTAATSRSQSRPQSGPKPASRLLGVLLAFFLALTHPLHAHAEGIVVTKAVIEQVEDGFQLNADFDVQFSQRLEEAVTRGVTLYFVVEFELSRPRWYWFDEKPVKLQQTYKISYTPLLRQYRTSRASRK
jgi:hypothetical protein